MSRLAFFDKLTLLEKLIRQEKTGTPDELSVRLSVSRVTLHRMIDDLKVFGVEIMYCRTRRSYCYQGNKVIDIRIKTKALTEDD